MIQDLLQHVKSLPPLPAAVERLVAAADDPDVNIRGLARIIVQDQALTARILKVANSAFYGFAQRVTTVSQAMVILGLQAVRNIALGVALQGLQKEEDPARRLLLEALWKHAVAVASAARLLAARTRTPNAEQAFVAGLLHDIGKIVLIKALGPTYLQLLQQAQAGAAPLHVLEQDALGIDHAAVGAALCSHWNIPPALARVVAGHHPEEPPSEQQEPAHAMLGTVCIANELAKIAGAGASGNPYVDARVLHRPGGAVPSFEHLQHAVRSLPGQVQALEAAFFDPPPASPQPPAGPERPALQIGCALHTGEARDAVALLVAQCGGRLVPLDDEQVPEGAAGLLVDHPLLPARTAQLTREDVPVHQLVYWTRPPSLRPFIFIEGLKTWMDHPLSTTPELL